MNIIREKKNKIIELKNSISELEDEIEALEPSDEENYKLLERYNLNMFEHLYEDMIQVCSYDDFNNSYVHSYEVVDVIRELEEKIEETSL